jgi:putative aminopeptidase FrvX
VIGGMKPPHVRPFEGRDRGQPVPLDEMYVDIGATSRAEAEAAGVRPGDAVVPKAEFEELAVPDSYLAKAFDDRVGCALLTQALQILAGGGHLPNRVYGVGTVMEEVGVRGVATALDIVAPDVAIVLEADVAGDTPNMTPEETTVRLGGGPSLLLFDPYLIPNQGLNDLVRDTAAALKLPLQVQMLSGGATDGAAIHLHRAGVPTMVLGVPARHMHTHGMILRREDYDCALSLLVAIVRRLDTDTVAGLVRF